MTSQVSSHEPQTSTSSYLLVPGAAGIGEAAVKAMVGHQDLVTHSSVSVRLRLPQEGEHLCVTDMHEPQQKDLFYSAPGWRE